MNDSQAISPAELRDALLHVCEAVQEQEQYLNDLDSAIGDGDHGITMRIGFAAVRKRLLLLPANTSSGTFLVEAGMTFMQSTGGAIGVILGRALTSSGAAIGGAMEMGPEKFKSCFAAMEKAVAQTGKAMPGDKTLLDPLHALNEVLSDLPAESLRAACSPLRPWQRKKLLRVRPTCRAESDARASLEIARSDTQIRGQFRLH